MYKVIYTEKARQDLKDLDNQIHKRIIQKIYSYSLMDNPMLLAKRLNNFQSGSYRFRIGDYRAIFDLDHKSKTPQRCLQRVNQYPAFPSFVVYYMYT